MIVVNAQVINDSSKNIVKGKIKLLEVSNYVGYNVGKTIPQSPYLVNVRGDNHREQRRKIATGEQELCIAKNSKGNVQLYLQVPSTVPSFNYCPIIKVEYVVELKFESTGSLNSNIETAVPVIIGTIPIRERLSQEPTPTSSKIYPSLPEMDSPPPYSQENIQGDSLLPPFSYVESVKGIEGTVIDKYSIEVSYMFLDIRSTHSYLKSTKRQKKAMGKNLWIDPKQVTLHQKFQISHDSLIAFHFNDFKVIRDV
ncbi:arrestin domain protein [Necator americanus]|uniref:Arrestin domain protein n=1 Tax=Necator americanus TaxID=51031 RepID=W2SI67_NECAM|nr:arrestin domain protein [Necator americanus]ETN69260.1 arrestin domain protein [Necator americanus]